MRWNDLIIIDHRPHPFKNLDHKFLISSQVDLLQFNRHRIIIKKKPLTVIRRKQDMVLKK